MLGIFSLGRVGGPVRTEFVLVVGWLLRLAPKLSAVPRATSAALQHSVQHDPPNVFQEIEVQLDMPHVFRHLQDDCVLWPVQLLPCELLHLLCHNFLSPFMDCHSAIGSNFAPTLLHPALSVVRLRMEQNALLPPASCRYL